MAFLRNRTVNLLNLHYAIHSLAVTGGGAFFAVFLLRAGVAAPAVLASLGAINAGRFLIRPLVLTMAKRWGLKPLVIAGTVLSGLQYPLLAGVHGLGWPLLALCVTSSVGETLYWTCYHAYFAALGDSEHRGHQLGVREAVAAIVGIVGPLLTGWALTTVGPQIAFDFMAVVLVLAAIPVLSAPNVVVARRAPGSIRAARIGVMMFAADGWSWGCQGFVWQIALFMTLGESFTAFGGAMALAALVGAISGLLLGRWIDLGHGARAAPVALGAMALIVVLRAVTYRDPVLAVTINAGWAVAAALYTPTIMTAVYNQAKASPCTLRFHIAAEGGYDAGAASGCLISAALLQAGAPFSAPILLSLLGTGAGFLLLRRYYRSVRQDSAAAPRALAL
jgi:hypothetical protein